MSVIWDRGRLRQGHRVSPVRRVDQSLLTEPHVRVAIWDRHRARELPRERGCA